MEKMVNQEDMFLGAYQGKRVLVTGHTGFKGSWLSLWLLELGAEVAGFSKYLPTDPCHFEAINLGKKLQDFRGDIRSFEQVQKVFDEFQPQVVFHLAAQPLVRESYQEPKITFDTNLGGTVNVLECIRSSKAVETAVIITTDKCYENVGWDWGYRENDHLGGEDPYSASKACAEIAFHAYFESFFKNHSVKIATARAGNVIGGGDWAKDRIVPDCIKAWNKKEIPVIRNPEATRPWQFVLEPISAYLWLGACLLQNKENVNGEAFNFGPQIDVINSVYELVELLLDCWGSGNWKHIENIDGKKEARLLKLSIDKAVKRLRWKPVLSFEETVGMTASWYKEFYANNKNLYDYSFGQIQRYVQKASDQKLPWVIEKQQCSKML